MFLKHSPGLRKKKGFKAYGQEALSRSLEPAQWTFLCWSATMRAKRDFLRICPQLLHSTKSKSSHHWSPRCSHHWAPSHLTILKLNFRVKIKAIFPRSIQRTVLLMLILPISRTEASLTVFSKRFRERGPLVFGLVSPLFILELGPMQSLHYSLLSIWENYLKRE